MPGGASFTGGFILGQHELFLNMFGEWYGTKQQGLAELREEADPSDPNRAGLWRDLETGDAVRTYFDRVVTGEVREGPPDVDGAPTWEFAGHVNADGVLDLVREYSQDGGAGGLGDLNEDEREAFRRVMEASRVTFLVGKEDLLPRRLDVSLTLDADDFDDLEALADDGFESGFFDVKLTLALPEFGKDVRYDPPENFEPLENFGKALFGGLA